MSTLPGISLEESDNIGRRAEELLLEVPEIQTVARKTGRAELDEHALGVNTSEIEAPFVLGDRSHAEVVADVRKKLSVIPGVNIEIGQPISHRIDAMLSGTQARIAIKLFGDDLNRMFMLGNQIKKNISAIDGVVDLNVEQQIERPQLKITPRREMLARYGVSLSEFAEFIDVALAGEVVSQVYEGSRTFDLTVKVKDDERSSAAKIGDLMVDTQDGKVPLSYLAEIKSATGPNTINRENVKRKIVISANVSDRVRKKYAEPRRTGILYDYAEDADAEEDAIEDYPVTLFLSQQGYFKKITPQSLRMSGEQKFKEDDALSVSVESSNAAELMFFTDRAQVYKTRASDFADGKASLLGDYLPSKLGMDEGESVMGMVLPGDYSGYMLFFFENGKAAKVELSAYKTMSNRRRLTGAYSDKSPLKALLHLREDREIAVYSTEPRVLIVNTALLGMKTTRTTQGVALLTLKKKYTLDAVRFPEETGITDLARYRGRCIPATGALLKTEDSDDKQLSLI